MLQEFKEFALKGNLVDLAVGFVLGVAFATVVTSLVENVITPIVAAIFGQPDFGQLSIDIGDSKILYGAFINAVIAFLLVALALFFFVIKPYNMLKKKQEEGSDEAPPPPQDIQLLTEIRDALQK